MENTDPCLTVLNTEQTQKKIDKNTDTQTQRSKEAMKRVGLGTSQLLW